MGRRTKRSPSSAPPYSGYRFVDVCIGLSWIVAMVLDMRGETDSHKLGEDLFLVLAGLYFVVQGLISEPKLDRKPVDRKESRARIIFGLLGLAGASFFLIYGAKTDDWSGGLSYAVMAAIPSIVLLYHGLRKSIPAHST